MHLAHLKLVRKCHFYTLVYLNCFHHWDCYCHNVSTVVSSGLLLVAFIFCNDVVDIIILIIMLCVDFTKAFDSIHRGKMEQILLAYGLPKETVAAITILFRNTKVKVRSPDGDTEYFDIIAGVLQGDTLAPYLFIICLDYVLKALIDKIRENGFELTKKRSTR